MLKLTDDALKQLRELHNVVYKDWFVGPTPGYLIPGQQADNQHRRVDPLTIRSPEHTEELATVWNYLLPTELLAETICVSRNYLPLLLDEIDRLKEEVKELEEQLKTKS